MPFVSEDLFGLDGEPIYPSAYDYYRTPSFENAKKFLAQASIYIPYEATRIIAEAAAADAERSQQSTNKLPYRSRYRYPEDCKGTKRRRGSDSCSDTELPDAEDIPGDFSIFNRANFIHHIHPYLSVCPNILRRILDIGIKIPERLRKTLWKHAGVQYEYSEYTLQEEMVERNPKQYECDATEILEEYFQLSPTLMRTSHLRDYHISNTVQVYDHLKDDDYMSRTVDSWLTTNGTGIAEFVLDGILEEPIDRPVSKGVYDHRHLQSLAICALLQWMIGKWPKPNGADHLQEIRFLTGSFSTRDVYEHNAFFNRWSGHLSRDGTALKNVGVVRVIRMEVCSVPNGVPNISIIPDDSGALIVHGRRVPFWGKVPPKPVFPYEKGKEMIYRLDDFFATPPVHQVIYTRYDLRAMFTAYYILTFSQKHDPAVEASVQQVLSVNAFRDAYKPDAALNRGAVYLTMDRLSLLYYELRRRALGAPNRGLAIITNQYSCGVGFKEYRSVRAAEP